MKIQSSYRIFFAFPFDPAIRPMYERIMIYLKKTFNERFQCVYGNSSVIQPSPKFLEYQVFKQQNTDLLKQFFSNIKSCDVVVADLTYNNPNVHVELGIALSLNKNILRVSGRSLTEIGSDVRGYEVQFYTSEEDLKNKIQNYIEQYVAIKELPLSKEAGPFYRLYYPEEKELRPHEYLPIETSFRDGGVKVKFQFKSARSGEDWFGIFFRHNPPNVWWSGYLLYARKGGSLEIASLPVNVLNRQDYGDLGLDVPHTIEFAVDGNKLVACLDNKCEGRLETEGLDFQSPGSIGLYCFETEVKFSFVETVCRDTITF
jgi:hypothetical protein